MTMMTPTFNVHTDVLPKIRLFLLAHTEKFKKFPYIFNIKFHLGLIFFQVTSVESDDGGSQKCIFLTEQICSLICLHMVHK